MQCTGCSSPVLPIVVFDIDGTMGDYHNHFCSFAASYLGYAHFDSDYNGVEPFRVWFCKAFDVDVRTFRDIKLAYRQGGQKRTMGVRDWARVATKVARDEGAEVWITTTRPYMRLDNVDPDTRWWLQRNGIKYDYLIYGEHKYEELANQVHIERVCFILDDLAEQLDKAKRFFDPESVYLYRSMWNSGHHLSYNSLGGGEVVIQTVLNRVKEWKTTH
jgi:hypothetical protein